MASGRIDLIESDDDFERDQDNDDEFEAQRSAGVDNIGERVGGFSHHGELPVERIDALLEFVFIFKPGIKPLQIGAVPKRIRLFCDRDATRHPVLDQKGISDQLQNPFSISSSTAVIGQLFREGFDNFEYFRDLAFVIGEHDTLRQPSAMTRSLSGDMSRS